MTTNTNYTSSDLVFRLVDGAQPGTLFPISTQKCLLGQSYDESGEENGHCAILRGPNGASIKSFGTEVVVNGQPIESQWLSEGDQIEIGAAKLEVVQLGNYVVPEREKVVEAQPQPETAPEVTVPQQHSCELTRDVTQAAETSAAASCQLQPTAQPACDQLDELNETMDQISADVSSWSASENSEPDELHQTAALTDPAPLARELDLGRSEPKDSAATTESIFSPLNPPQLLDQSESIGHASAPQKSFQSAEKFAEPEGFAEDLRLERAFASFHQPTTKAEQNVIEECSDCPDEGASHCESPVAVAEPESASDEQARRSVQNQKRVDAELAAEARLREVFSKHLHDHADEIVYNPEEDKTLESEPVENETVSQLLARMQEQGQLHGYRAEDDNNEVQNRASAELIADAQPNDSLQQSGGQAAKMHEDDADASVQDYMNRLLGRMGPQVAPAAKSAAPKVIADEPQNSARSDTAESVDLLTPSEYKPSKRPPEANKNLDAMRELANQSNRVAIEKSQSRQAKAYALTNFGLMALGLALGSYLVYNATGTTDSMMWTGGVVLGISLFLGGAGVRALVSKKVSTAS